MRRPVCEGGGGGPEQTTPDGDADDGVRSPLWANAYSFAQAQSNESRISVANQRATKLLKD